MCTHAGMYAHPYTYTHTCTELHTYTGYSQPRRHTHAAIRFASSLPGIDAAAWCVCERESVCVWRESQEGGERLSEHINNKLVCQHHLAGECEKQHHV